MTDLHLTVDPGARGLARRIAAQLREAVRSGRLASGTTLPASRRLAADLAVSRGSVVEAYEQLIAEGFLTSRQGAGTRVAPLPEPPRPAAPAVSPATRPSRYPMRVGTPDLAAFPRQAWLAATRTVLRNLPHSELGYPDPAGVPRLRQALAEYLGRVRAARAEAENIVVVGGAAHGLSLTFRALGALDLAVEDPSATGQLPLLRDAGATLIPTPVDSEGIDVSRVRDHNPDAVLLTPAHQYPTGAVLSPRRRAELREWLLSRRATAVEDDYDAEFRYDREPVGCLQGLLPDRVVLLGSTSKTLAPGLRLGWVVAPAPLADAVGRLRARSDLGAPVLEQHVLAHLIETGEYDRHVRAMRRRYRARRDALIEALDRWLPQARVRGVSAGQHLLVEFDDGDDVAVADRAAQLGVEVSAATRFRVEAAGPPGLVLGFAELSSERIRQAVRLLAQAVTPSR